MCLPLNARQALVSFWIKLFHGLQGWNWLLTVPTLTIIPVMTNSRNGCSGGKLPEEVLKNISDVHVVGIGLISIAQKQKVSPHLYTCFSSSFLWFKGVFSKAWWKRREICWEERKVLGVLNFRVPNLISQKAAGKRSAFPRGASLPVCEYGGCLSTLWLFLPISPAHLPLYSSPLHAPYLVLPWGRSSPGSSSSCTWHAWKGLILIASLNWTIEVSSCPAR